MCDPLDVDPISLENLGNIPSDYIIVLEQNNKLFCFDVRSLYSNIFEYNQLTNPLTNQPWTSEQIDEVQNRQASISLLVRQLQFQVPMTRAQIDPVIGRFSQKTLNLSESMNTSSKYLGGHIVDASEYVTTSKGLTLPEQQEYHAQPWQTRWATEDRSMVYSMIMPKASEFVLGYSVSVHFDTGNFQWITSMLQRINSIVVQAFRTNADYYSVQDSMKLFLQDDAKSPYFSLGQLIVSMTQFHNDRVSDATQTSRTIRLESLVEIRNQVRETQKQLFEEFLERFRDFWIRRSLTRV